MEAEIDFAKEDLQKSIMILANSSTKLIGIDEEEHQGFKRIVTISNCNVYTKKHKIDQELGYDCDFS